MFGIMNKGIKVKELAIVIIVFLMIIAMAFYAYNYSNNMNELQYYIYNLEKVQSKVNQIRNEYKLSENYNPNEAGNFYNYLKDLGFKNANSSSYNSNIDDFNLILEEYANKEQTVCWDNNVDQILANYFYFSPIDIKEFFDIDNFDDAIIVNFYTGNIISKNGIKDSDGKIIHRQYDSKIGNKITLDNIFLSNIDVKLEVLKNYGLKQDISISIASDNTSIEDVYYYTDSNDELLKCSNLDNYSYDEKENTVKFTITKSEHYYFIAKDTNYIDYKIVDKNIELVNPPKLFDGMYGIYWDENNEEKIIDNELDPNWYDYSNENKKFANVRTQDGNYYVWIPRFVYFENEENTDIKFIIGHSNTSPSLISTLNYKINESFKSDIDGFWVAKFQSTSDDKLEIKPGKTLRLVSKDKAKYNSSVYRNNSDLMYSFNKDLILNLSKYYECNVLNDLVHYSGGSSNSEDFKKNTQYSSTNNVYGIYDLLTSENEIYADSNSNEIGRFRNIIY